MIPDAEGARSQETVVHGAEQMSAHAEEILHRSVHREKQLRVPGGLEAAHLAFPLSGCLVRDLGPVVRVPVRAVDYGRHHGAAGRGVATEFVGEQSSGDTASSFQQLAEEPDGRPPIATGLDQDVDHVSVLVNGTPQILLPPLDLDEHLVQIPGVAHPASAAPQSSRVVEPEGQTPLPNRLVCHDDTPLGKEIFDISETQAEAMVEPVRVTDDLRGESVFAVAWRLGRHRPTVAPAAST
jgi:hypothetical protein